MSKLIFILGATCSGKTAISLEIAVCLPKTCIINCDSRQIYKDFDIISAKVKGSWIDSAYFVDYKNVQIPHFLIDFVDFGRPNESVFGILDYLEAFDNLSLENFENVLIVGGTGYWAKSLLEFVTGKYQVCKNPNQAEFKGKKQELSQLNLQELQQIYPNYKSLNQSDSQNPIRIINKILGQSFAKETINHKSRHYFDQIYQFLVSKKLDELPLLEAVKNRFDLGLMKETEELSQKYGTQKLLQFGLEYKNLLILKSKQELILQSYLLNRQYAKRQITWFQKQNLIPITNYLDILNTLTTCKKPSA